ncbi:hypothetical protein [Acinetobacter sp. BY419]|uniref:hypothetical protein n=1 Tax=unclassified Acinetobacter TaxID=196816 RepID=UPI001C235549|nr:hypothetical protein [Acinetobacter sp. BY419]
MPRNNYLPALEQVYEFLKERPSFKDKSEFDKAVEYFRTLHESDPLDFRVQASSAVAGKFGAKETIHLGSMPKFSDKENFINWIDTQINH